MDGRPSRAIEVHALEKTLSQRRRALDGSASRLDIAIGLVRRPAVLFLDEPTTGLDPEVRADMWDEIARLSREGGHHHPCATPGAPSRRPSDDHSGTPG